MDIMMAVGLAAAVGLRPFLPALAAGLMSRADIGLSLGDFGFLGSWPFLAVLVLLAVLFWVFEALATSQSARKVLSLTTGIASVTLGALLFAAVLSAQGYSPLPGIVAGAAVAATGRFTASVFTAGAARRVQKATAQKLFIVYLEPVAVVIAILAILIPPVSVLPIAAFAFVLVTTRKRKASKFEGLRILR